ncbi:MAG TPA: outer membrane beta-barrel protein [Bacteroidia bacterium]|jgi:hypothetical protein|nr:outer membrane beta-barrel protein [Bacteroidia bacterium]
MRNKTTFLIASCLAGTYSFAQSTPKELPAISVGTGLTLFNGDVGKDSHTGGNFRSAWRFGIEQRLNDWVGAEVFANYGTLSKSERSLTLNRNFQSPLLFVGLNGIFYFDNNAMIPRNALFSPYFTAGFGWMSFDPHGDLKDKNNKTYYYWSNGSIHDLAENDPMAASSLLLQRDYTYETQLKDSTTNYTRSTFAVPLGMGARFRFGDHFGANVQANYFITFSDYLDNVKDGGNDSWWWLGCSIYYKFGKVDHDKSDGIDVHAMMNEDYDGDGVVDANDQCQGTPKGVKVDHKGCPVDSDDDGIADYLDKEPNSKHGAIVDGNGVAIDYDKIAQQAHQDSLNEAQRDSFALHPSQHTLQQGNVEVHPAKTGDDCIPAEYRAADVNKDCVITADEINTVIDNFFDGVGGWTADGINKLIDYFFDQ